MNVLIVGSTEFRLFNHLYAVAVDGSVLKVTTQSPVKAKIRKDGYAYVASKYLIHRLVAHCWVRRRSQEATEVHHINGIKTDNRASNLKWVTHKEHLSQLHNFAGRYVRSAETRQKIRDYRTGRKTSEETKAKQRTAALRLGQRPPSRQIGFTVSPATIARQRETHPRNTTCEIDGVAYRSFAEAGRSLGVRALTIRKRCISPRFPNYKVS